MNQWRVAILGCLLTSVGWPTAPAASAQSGGPPAAGPSGTPVTTTSFAGSRPVDGRTNPDTRRAQVEAATEDAIDILRRDVLASSLAPDLTVRQFLNKTGGTDALVRRIDNAEQRGGTRWRGDDACEVLLEIPGADVADTLGKIAIEKAKTSGISFESLKQGLADLRGRTFSALGVSVGADRLDRIRPDNPNGAWRSVSDEQRREALKGAKANAIARVIESLRPIDLGNGKRLDEALNAPGVTEDLRHWIASRPVTSVEFGDDLQVRLTLAAPAEDLWPVLQRALAQQRQVQGLPTNPDGWEHLRQEVLHDAAPAVGRSIAVPDKAPAPPPTTGAAPARGLPHQPPAWVNEQFEADGTAQGAPRDLLKTARAAEDKALADLRSRIDQLPVGDTTLGMLAKQDDRLQQAIKRTLRRAQATKIHYDPPRGGATVHISLPLEQLWRELDAAR
jgi:hypothetical protein